MINIVYISSSLIPSLNGGIKMDEMLVLLFDGENDGYGYTDPEDIEVQDGM